MEVQGDLNNALTQPQNQDQLNNVAVNSTLPTEPATVAPLRNGAAAPRQTTDTAERQTTPRTTERKQTVIDPKSQSKTQSKPQATQTAPKAVPVQPKRT